MCLCVRRAAYITYQLHATLVLAAKVMRCIQCTALERSGLFCRSVLKPICVTSAPRPPAPHSARFSNSRSPLRSAHPTFWPAPLRFPLRSRSDLVFSSPDFQYVLLHRWSVDRCARKTRPNPGEETPAKKLTTQTKSILVVLSTDEIIIETRPVPKVFTGQRYFRELYQQKR